MKTICFGAKGIRHYSDSSVQRNYHPFFIPDTATEWEAIVCPAIRISRLGTHISEKFAGRYFDNVSVACLFLPCGAAQDITAVPEKYFIADSMFCVGESVQCDAQDTVHTISTGIGNDLIFSATTLSVNKVIADLSKFATLKMGDLILFTDFYMSQPVSEGDHVIVTIDGNVSVDVKIK